MDELSAFNAITAVGATTTQTSRALTNREARTLVLRLDVTSGVTLDLDIALVAVLQDGTEQQIAQSTTAVTGVATQTLWFVPGFVAVDAARQVDVTIAVPIPVIFKLRVVHGNANAASYTLDALWT